jgi:alpha-N-acetylglucosaminidase
VQVAQGVSAALTCAPNMVGVGMAPEGIEHNPAVYEFMAEMAFQGRAASAAADITPWFQAYAARRYAAAGELPPGAAASIGRAWSLIARSLYSCADHCHNTVADIPTSRPGLSRVEITGWGLGPHLWYDVREVRAAWEALLSAAAAAPQLATSSSAFVYDLLDVSRELMSKIAGRFWADAADTYRAGDMQGLQASSRSLLMLLEDLDQLLGAHKAFLLAPNLQRARNYSSLGAEGQPPAPDRQQALAEMYERNLRTQLTIWGTSAAHGDSEVSDYANKEWSGLISTFYLPRWRAWLGRLQQDLQQQRPYDPVAWRLEVLNSTYAWISSADLDGLPVVAQGDPLQLARQAFERYGSLLAPGGGAGAAGVVAPSGAAVVEAGALAGASTPIAMDVSCERVLSPTPPAPLEPMYVVA